MKTVFMYMKKQNNMRNHKNNIDIYTPLDYS